MATISSRESTGELFSADGIGGVGECHKINLPDAEIELYPNFIPAHVRQNIFDLLRKRIDWKQEQIRYYGKMIDLPRLTAWYGDGGIEYKYSGIRVEAAPWLPILHRIKCKIESIHSDKLNCVLLNLYRHQKDSVSWHSDDEKELGKNPVIASISLGEVRSFHLRHKFEKSLSAVKVELTDGSLLLMRGSTQHFWQHQIPKTTKRLGERINLTYRFIDSGV
jgi:alkylated DNA repair dioxygenase AlkB